MRATIVFIFCLCMHGILLTGHGQNPADRTGSTTLVEMQQTRQRIVYSVPYLTSDEDSYLEQISSGYYPGIWNFASCRGLEKETGGEKEKRT